MYYLNHATLRRSTPRCPDRAGCLPRCVRTDGRVKFCGKIVPTLDTGRTAHFRAVAAQRGALTPDVRPVAPASAGCQIWPAIDHARSCECHATTTHITAAVEGVCWHYPRPERLRLALCHLCRRMCASQTIYWDMTSSRRELALGADVGCLVLSWNHQKSTRASWSWCVTNTDTQTITPLRRLRLNLSLRLSARHTTRTRHDPRRAPRPRHTHRPLAAPAGQHARSRAKRNIFFGSSSSRRRRWCVWVVQELPEMPQPPENKAGLPASRPMVILKGLDLAI